MALPTSPWGKRLSHLTFSRPSPTDHLRTPQHKTDNPKGVPRQERTSALYVIHVVPRTSHTHKMILPNAKISSNRSEESRPFLQPLQLQSPAGWQMPGSLRDTGGKPEVPPFLFSCASVIGLIILIKDYTNFFPRRFPSPSFALAAREGADVNRGISLGNGPLPQPGALP